MSYNLLFVAAESGPNDPLAWFRERPHYTVKGEQAIYEHPDTGVYFVFELATASAPDEPAGTWLWLNLNLIRPHFFADEAAIEVAAVVAATQSLVYDPQDEGSVAQPFDAESFIYRWNSANQKGIRATLDSPDEDVASSVAALPTRPRTTLSAIWQWNAERMSWQDSLSEDAFVPAVIFLRQDEVTCTSVVWGDAIPILLPQVDVVIIVRDTIRKRGWFGGAKDSEMAVVKWEELIARLPPASLKLRSLTYYDLSTLQADKQFLAFLQDLPALRTLPDIVGHDQVLDAENVAG